MQAINERELVERCRRGGEGACQGLVDRYKAVVLGRCMPWVSARSPLTVQERARAEDLSQEVFLRIHRGLPYFRGEARLSTWIHRIVANVCAQARTRTPVSVSLDDERSAAMRPSGADPQFAGIELRDRLEKA